MYCTYRSTEITVYLLKNQMSKYLLPNQLIRARRKDMASCCHMGEVVETSSRTNRNWRSTVNYRQNVVFNVFFMKRVMSKIFSACHARLKSQTYQLWNGNWLVTWTMMFSWNWILKANRVMFASKFNFRWLGRSTGARCLPSKKSKKFYSDPKTNVESIREIWSHQSMKVSL